MFPTSQGTLRANREAPEPTAFMAFPELSSCCFGIRSSELVVRAEDGWTEWRSSRSDLEKGNSEK
jgi:hypothetical protein